MSGLAAKLAGVRRTLALSGQRMRALGASPRLAYIGGEGVGNLGDDAMFQAARQLLGESALLSLGPEERERRLAPFGLAGGKYFEGAVLGGGTLINPLWLPTVERAVASKLPAWTLGTGVGSCGFAQAPQVELEGWSPLLAEFRALGVRGPRSRETLRRLGLKNPCIVGDPALALCRDEAQEPDEPPKFALSVFLPPGEGAAGPMLRALADAAQELLDRGWEAVPVALHWSDRRALRRTLQLLGQEGTEILPLPSTDAFFERVGPCTLMLGVRLHSAVLACCCGVPPLLLGYREKCFDFMDSMELGDWCVPWSAPGEVGPRLHRLTREAAGLRATVLERARRWKAVLYDYAREISPRRIGAEVP